MTIGITYTINAQISSEFTDMPIVANKPEQTKQINNLKFDGTKQNIS